MFWVGAPPLSRRNRGEVSDAYLNQAGWWGQAKRLQIKGRWGGVWRVGGLQAYECWRSHPGAAQAKNI